MLAEMTPEEMDELEADDLLGPFDASWKQAAEICATVINSMKIANMKDFKETDITPASVFIPRLKCLPKPEAKEERPQSWASLAKSYGAK